jgi:hypothetical protein
MFKRFSHAAFGGVERKDDMNAVWDEAILAKSVLVSNQS